jgi:tRNA pseudouridine55 synthase
MSELEHRLLVLNKHSGPTSFDVVEAVRRAIGIKKVGHTGTLDPLATGVLLVCTGRASRAVEQFMNLGKTYEFTMLLGVETSTLDAEGEILRQASVPEIPEADIIAAARDFVGPYDMAPPAFSAIKKNGKRLYELARAGEKPVAESRLVTIHELEVTKVALPEIGLRMRCSRGTYVRSFARDFGAAFGLPAHLRRLIRLAIGPFAIEDAYPCEKVFDGDVSGLSGIELSDALSFLPGIVLTDGSRRALVDGALPRSDDIVETIGALAESSTVRILDQSGVLLALGSRGRENRGDVTLVDSFRLVVDRRSVVT